jgi:four helix bundle protein
MNVCLWMRKIRQKIFHRRRYHRVMQHILSYKDLIVWQKAAQLSLAIYELTQQFPQIEQYGLSSQMRRAAVSIASNIAEGRQRGSRKSFLYFLHVSYGSGAELETQVWIAKRLPSTSNLDYQKIDSLLDEVMRMLNKLIGTIRLTKKQPLIPNP